MSFPKYIIIIFFLTAWYTANAQQNNVISLQQCLDVAVRNNLQVKQTGLTMEADSVNYLQTKENLLPTLNGQVSRTLSQGRALSPVTNTYVNQGITSDNYGLGSNLTLFSGLYNQNAIKQTRLAYQAGKMDFQSAKDIFTINIITAYLTVLDDEEQLGQSKSQLAVAKEALDRSTILEKQGANTTASAFYDLKGSYSGSSVAVVSTQNAVTAAKVILFQYMNIPYNKDAELQPLNAEDLAGNYGINPDQVYQTALQQLAVVKAATLRRQSAEKGVKQAQGLLFPTLTLSGGINTNYNSAAQNSVFTDSTTSAVPGLYTNSAAGKQSVYETQANYAAQNINYINQFKNNYGTYVGLTLNIPILNYRQKKNAVALAKINLLTLQNVEDNTKIQLQQNIEQAFYNMTAAHDRYQALQDEASAYTESFRISKLRFDAGVLTSVDYITSKNNMDAANLNLISARYDYFIYSKILDYYQGKLSF
jgi:outer membrane protein